MMTKILWVDDQIESMGSYVDALRKTGVSVEAFPSAQTALEKVISGRFTHLLVDLSMPEMSGIEFLHSTFFPATLVALQFCRRIYI